MYVTTKKNYVYKKQLRHKSGIVSDGNNMGRKFENKLEDAGISEIKIGV